MNKKNKILLIDDEEDFCYFVKLNLERTGKFDVLVSTNAKGGLDAAKKEKPDLILLDILMPEMDGSEVAQNLLEDESTCDIPIIFLTAMVQKRELKDKEGIIAGRQFIAKPVTSEELISRIESVLKGK